MSDPHEVIANVVIGDTYDPATNTYPDKIVGKYVADRIAAALAADGFVIVPVWTGTVRHQVTAAKETK